MVTIIQKYDPPLPIISSVQKDHSRAVEHVIREMRANLSLPYVLDDFAEMANYSPFHFARLFRNVVGVPPGEFLAALRFERAKQLILTTQGSITDICFDVGFSSLGTFSSRFKYLVGRSPAELRTMPEQLHYRLGALEPRLATCAKRIGGTVVRGSILSTEPRKGHVFIGLFPSAIPQSSPAAGTLTGGPGPFRLTGVQPGTYHLLAAQFPLGDDPLAHLLPGSSSLLCGSDPAPVVVQRDGTCRPLRLELRPPNVLDPPILSALAPSVLGL